jgi:hypothetical protein
MINVLLKQYSNYTPHEKNGRQQSRDYAPTVNKLFNSCWIFSPSACFLSNNNLMSVCNSVFIFFLYCIVSPSPVRLFTHQTCSGESSSESTREPEVQRRQRPSMIIARKQSCSVESFRLYKVALQAPDYKDSARRLRPSTCSSLTPDVTTSRLYNAGNSYKIKVPPSRIHGKWNLNEK